MPLENKKTYSELIKAEAMSAGFSNCGISKACFLSEEVPRLEKWLKNNNQSAMKYMENNLDKRLNPMLLVEGTKSVISLVYNYFSENKQCPDSHYVVAQYALLNDYHFFLKQKMKLMVEVLKKTIGDFDASYFVDSAPILEKAWAVKSGLGWVGKNSLLNIPQKGTYYFICQILTNLELEYDKPLNKEFCGSCRKCIDACPTKALNENRTIDTNKCISYLTISHKDPIDTSIKEKFDHQIFGCDICQQVCPMNTFKTENKSNDIYFNKQLTALKKEDWERLDENNFQNIFKNSPIYRNGLKKIKYNIEYLNF